MQLSRDEELAEKEKLFQLQVKMETLGCLCLFLCLCSCMSACLSVFRAIDSDAGGEKGAVEEKNNAEQTTSTSTANPCHPRFVTNIKSTHFCITFKK